jgi:4-hydroxyphenylpyruvate dioxygenase
MSPELGRPRRAIATVCLSGTLEDKLAAASAAGFDGVEIFENDLVASAESPKRLREHCQDLGLSIDLYQPFRDFEAVPPDLLAANLRRAEKKFDVMAELGTTTMLVCSTVSPDAVDDDDLAAEHLHLLASRAAERGLRIAYEALAWGRHVNTYDHSWRLVRRADHPALGLCLDSFHILSRGSDPAGIRIIPAEKLFFLQLADAPRLNMDVLQWSRHHRLFPSQGSFDLTRFLDIVLTTGYDGPLSLEVFNDVFRQADPRRAAVDALRSLVNLQESVARNGSERARARARQTELPAPPPLRGHSFVELSVDDTSAPEVTSALAALGFTHAGQHRSKPVQLWQQHDIRVLVNSAAGTENPTGQTSVAALAVESADPPASARRAEQLLAPVLPREHRAGEADLSAVAAPDGTSMFFCRTGADSWLADFTPTGNDGPPDVGLTAIDHVALTQPFDNFDEAALFYQSVLGLRPDSRGVRRPVRPDPQPVDDRRRAWRPDRAQRSGATPRRLVPRGPEPATRRVLHLGHHHDRGARPRTRAPCARHSGQLLRRPRRPLRTPAAADGGPARILAALRPRRTRRIPPLLHPRSRVPGLLRDRATSRRLRRLRRGQRTDPDGSTPARTARQASTRLRSSDLSYGRHLDERGTPHGHHKQSPLPPTTARRSRVATFHWYRQISRAWLGVARPISLPSPGWT